MNNFMEHCIIAAIVAKVDSNPNVFVSDQIDGIVFALFFGQLLEILLSTLLVSIHTVYVPLSLFTCCQTETKPL